MTFDLTLDQQDDYQVPPGLDTPYNLPLFIDSTMISTFKACPRKFFLMYGHNIKPRGTSIHLSAGGAIAAALHAARQYQGQFDHPLDIDILCEQAIGPFLVAWGQCPMDDPENAKNPHNTFYAFEQYLEKWHPFYDNIQPLRGSDGRPTSEFSFAIPLDLKHPNGDPFIYVGRFDLLGLYRENNLLVVLDDKTTGSISKSWMAQWDLRGQFLGYLWALRKLGYNISHVVVRGIGLLKTDIVLQDVPLQYPDYLIERWERSLYQNLDLMSHYYKHNIMQDQYNLADACSSYGGCPMKDLCYNKDPDNWLTNFQVEIWNPVSGE